MSQPSVYACRSGKMFAHLYKNLFGKAFRMWQNLLLLGPLGTVLGTACIRPETPGYPEYRDDVVTDAGEVLDTAAADHDHGVLLQGVAHAGNVGGDS